MFPSLWILHIGGVWRFPEVGVETAGTILQCSLILTEQSLLSTSVGCHLVSGLGTVGLRKQHVFRAATQQTLSLISTTSKPAQYHSTKKHLIHLNSKIG